MFNAIHERPVTLRTANYCGTDDQDSRSLVHQVLMALGSQQQDVTHIVHKTSQRTHTSTPSTHYNPSSRNPQGLSKPSHQTLMSPIIDIHLPSPSIKKTHGRQTSYQGACRAKLFISRASHSVRNAGNTPLFRSQGGGRGWLCYFLMKKKIWSLRRFSRFCG
jgi:hypothetical protein